MNVPDDVEAMWILMRPPCLPRTVTCIIMCVTYFPPRSVNADAYLDHFTTATDELLMKYPGAGVTILGDTNDLDLQPLLNGNRFIQVVDQPTRGGNILDKIITNYSHLYTSVSIHSPIGRSDHNCVLWTPSPRTRKTKE